MERELYIIGAGRGADVVIEYLRHMDSWHEECQPPISIEGIFDDDSEFDQRLGIPVIGKVCEVNNLPPETLLCISSSNMGFRRKIWELFGQGRFFFMNILMSKPSSSCDIGLGQSNLVFPNVIMGPFAEINDNNVISTSTVINHHCKIGDGNLFGPGCMLSGSVTIGNNCTFGSGIIFEPRVVIEDNVSIVSGTVISKGTKVKTRTQIKAHIQLGNGIYQGDRVVREIS